MCSIVELPGDWYVKWEAGILEHWPNCASFQMLLYLLDCIQANQSMAEIAVNGLTMAKSLLTPAQMAGISATWKCLHEELGAIGYGQVILILGKQLSTGLSMYRDNVRGYRDPLSS